MGSGYSRHPKQIYFDNITLPIDHDPFPSSQCIWYMLTIVEQRDDGRDTYIRLLFLSRKMFGANVCHKEIQSKGLHLTLVESSG